MSFSDVCHCTHCSADVVCGVIRPGSTDEEAVENLVTRLRQEHIDDHIIVNVG